MSKKSADLILKHVFTVASTSKGRSCYITFIWEENSKFVVWFSFISGFIGIFIIAYSLTILPPQSKMQSKSPVQLVRQSRPLS